MNSQSLLSPTSILALAFEPLESQVLFRTLESLNNKLGTKATLLLCDSWHKYDSYGSMIYTELKERSSEKVVIDDLFDIYDADLREVNNSNNYLSRLEYLIPSKSLRTLIINTDIYFHPHERRPFYGRFTEKERAYYCVRFFEALRRLVVGSSINLVLTIERNYLVKNLMSIVCKDLQINYLTVAHSRIRDYHTVQRYGFPFPFSDGDDLESGVKSQRLSQKNDYDLAERLCKKLESSLRNRKLLWRAPLLDVPSIKHWTFLARSLKDFKSRLSADAKFLIKNLLDRRFKKQYGRPHPILPILYTFRRLISSFYVFFFAKMAESGCPEDLGSYYYFPLQYRPETSNLTLSGGMSDEIAIKRILKCMPPTSLLVVREHPLMYGERSLNFYHNLRKDRRLRIVYDDYNSIDYILGSQGVLSVTGTVLLEAIILGKKSFCLGNPEFIEIYIKSNTTCIRNFFSNLYDYSKVKDEFMSYLASLLPKSFQGVLSWEMLKDPVRMEVFCQSLASTVATQVSEERSRFKQEGYL